ncbi:MAG: SPOR domain-containing protein [Gammaproteobacteria bacterium]|nr:SPOR domain-containing protein [Gammaproteobacteria bacterium]
MKWVFGSLLVLNAALVLWATGHRQGSVDGIAQSLPAVNPAEMLLLTEKVLLSHSETDSATCVRIGPFALELNAAVAASRLDELGISYTRRAINARHIRAHRVYIGPFQDMNAANQALRELQFQEVEEYYVMNDANSQVAVSLGLFSQQNTAERYIEELASKNVSAHSRVEDLTLGASHWLELHSTESPAALQQQLRTVDWAEATAELRNAPCT